MKRSFGIKVGLVSAFACLALLLSLLASTGVVSAHTLQTNSQQNSSVSSAADQSANFCPPHQHNHRFMRHHRWMVNCASDNCQSQWANYQMPNYCYNNGNQSDQTGPGMYNNGGQSPQRS